MEGLDFKMEKEMNKKKTVFPELVLKLKLRKWDLREVFHVDLTMWPFMGMSLKGNTM